MREVEIYEKSILVFFIIIATPPKLKNIVMYIIAIIKPQMILK